MNWIEQIWGWLKQPEIAGALGAIAAVAGVLWAVYTHFSKRKSSDVTITTIDPKALNELVTPYIEMLREKDRQLVEAHKALGSAEQRKQLLQDQIENLKDAVAAIPKQTDIPDAQARIKNALDEVRQGHTTAAETIFQEVLEYKSEEARAANKEAAEAARHLGALAFLHDTQKALDAYRRATELDPENADGWKRLGELLYRIGELDEAGSAFQKIISLGQSKNDRMLIAIGYDSLGIVYRIRGKLEQAEAMYKKSLAIDEALGRKEGMANSYTNLGLVYRTRGDLELAEVMYNKALVIDEALGRNEGMAKSYGNLGIIYKTRGELEQAEAMYEKALVLFRAVGAKRQIAQTQRLRDKVKEQQQTAQRR